MLLELQINGIQILILISLLIDKKDVVLVLRNV